MAFIEQFVMAYGAEQDRIRAILPKGFTSLRPVLRINAEIIDNKNTYLEFNTAVQKGNTKGWLNIGFWNDAEFKKCDGSYLFRLPFLNINFKPIGIEGTCPAAHDDDGCFFLGNFGETFRPYEQIFEKREFCDCVFQWDFKDFCVSGSSVGKILPAIFEKPAVVYEKENFSVKNAARIECRRVLGSYAVRFERQGVNL